MKKITSILLAVVMLVSVLTVSTFAATFDGNVSLYAAESALEYAKTKSGTDGELAAIMFEGENTFYNFYSDLLGGSLYSSKGVEVDFSANVFDIAVGYNNVPDLPIGMVQAYLYFNPAVVKPVNLNGVDFFNLGTNSNYSKTKLVYRMFEEIEVENGDDVIIKAITFASPENAFTNISDDDGEILFGYASAENALEKASIEYDYYSEDDDIYYNNELIHVPFELVNDGSNWYRTKISLDYKGVGGLDADYATVELYPTLSAPVYYYNTNYEGPTFDIVGAAKRADGELRFGSVYFSGLNANHDETTTIVDAGIVCLPANMPGSNELTLNTTNRLVISAAGYYAIDGNDYIYTGVITGLPEDMYITALSFVTYMVGEDEVTVYSDPITLSIDWCETVGNEL